MLRTLMLLRHAKSDWDSAGTSDFDRPLNARGKRAAPLIGRFIAEYDQPPQWIVTSPAVRALATAEAVAAELDEVALLQDETLYGAGVHEVLSVARNLPHDVTSALLVGHNPGMEWLAGELSGDPTVEMKTATLVVFEFDGEWSELSSECCRLALVQSARELDAEGES